MQVANYSIEKKGHHLSILNIELVSMIPDEYEYIQLTHDMRNSIKKSLAVDVRRKICLKR